MSSIKEGTVAACLPATFRATQLARAAIEEMPDLDSHEDLQFATALLTSELVANAVRHAGLAPDDDVGLLVECSGGVVHVEVSDAGPGFFPLPYAVSRTGHSSVEHGLHFVDVIADRWGFRSAEHRCCVWFELDLVPGRRQWRGRAPAHFTRRRGARTPSARPRRR
jgi:anti-sigma regulatory factor (Ser/Thr protein kinase)